MYLWQGHLTVILAISLIEGVLSLLLLDFFLIIILIYFEINKIIIAWA